MNLFVAILLEAFAEGDEEEEGGKEEGGEESPRGGEYEEPVAPQTERPWEVEGQIRWPRDYALMCFSPTNP
eukprot:1177876-Prymnesium_polylepis.1